MAGLSRSDVSYKRSGSSGLVWDDKLLSGELRPKEKEEEGKEKKEAQRLEPRPYKTMEVAPTIDPPSPRLSGCGAICTMFGKPVKSKPSNHNHNQKPRKKR